MVKATEKEHKLVIATLSGLDQFLDKQISVVVSVLEVTAADDVKVAKWLARIPSTDTGRPEPPSQFILQDAQVKKLTQMIKSTKAGREPVPPVSLRIMPLSRGVITVGTERAMKLAPADGAGRREIVYFTDGLLAAIQAYTIDGNGVTLGASISFNRLGSVGNIKTRPVYIGHMAQSSVNGYVRETCSLVYRMPMDKQYSISTFRRENMSNGTEAFLPVREKISTEGKEPTKVFYVVIKPMISPDGF